LSLGYSSHVFFTRPTPIFCALSICEKRMKKTFDIKVFISGRESCCEECHENLGRKAWITLVEDKGALCLSCADIDHLVFLPAGDAALTRRARKHSTLSAVVLKWSRARKRYELESYPQCRRREYSG